jgi:serine/threonine-protein kinase
MNEPPDQTNDGAGLGLNDRLETSDQDEVTSVGINLGETERGRADTDPRSTTTQAFAGECQKFLPERYRLIEMIGRGGMADVFLAEDTRLNRRVAIKFLSGEFRKDSDRTRRFTREARAASALNHPNILIIHDIGESDDAQFIVSEYVEGETLGFEDPARQDPARRGGEHRDPGGLGSGLLPTKRESSQRYKAGQHHASAGWERQSFGLWPRERDRTDLVAFSDEGREDTRPGFDVTRLILGTPQYMSPEQTRGIDLDPRTDIFSLGNIIFEMVTGHVPFPG